MTAIHYKTEILYFKLILLSALILLLTAFGNVFGQRSPVHFESRSKIHLTHVFVAPDGNDYYPGTRAHPYQHIQFGIDQLLPGDTLTVLPGTYSLKHELYISLPGKDNYFTVIEGELGSSVVLDGNEAYIPWNRNHMQLPAMVEIHNSQKIVLRNFKIRNSHFAGINIRDSKNIDVFNCHVENTLASGIATWPGCSNIRILGNAVINANDTTWSWGPYYGYEAPHEAISIIGTEHFEVAYNLLKDCKKEGVDVKGASAYGTVHHNYFYGVLRQGLYVDCWSGVLEDIEMYDNIVTHGGWGAAVSTEGGILTRNIRIHHNIFDHNLGPGIFISRWHLDNKREDIRIYNNTLYKNGIGKPQPGWKYFWLVGGCYIYSTHIENLDIRNNIFSSDYPFEIGYTYKLHPEDFKEKKITIAYNLLNPVKQVKGPVYLAQWAKDTVLTTSGDFAVLADPQFTDPEQGDFRLKKSSPAINAGDPDARYRDPDGSRNDMGAIPLHPAEKVLWWKVNFPPRIINGKPDW